MKIILEREKCIGCGSCVSVCPKFFEMGEDGKSHLKKSEYNGKKEIEELEVKEPGCVAEAAELCPAECIKVLAQERKP